MRRFALAGLLVLVAAPPTLADPDATDESQGGVFFRDPDRETGARIAELISRVASGSVLDRAKARRELESIGYWSIDPLIDAATRLEPPIRGASVLVLDAIHDARAVEPLRAIVARETSQQYVAGFAALALGRFGDPGAIDVFRAAVKTPKSMETLKAAVPAALARIRTPEARDLLIERVRAPGLKEPARSAALLCLGFFPDVAVAANGTFPGPDLAAALLSKRRGERQAALLGFLVAASAFGDVKAPLREVLASESAAEVSSVALIGLSRSSDADVTEFLAKTAERGEESLRELAADLLIDRVDGATKPTVIQVARTATSARLRAACVLALGRLEDEDARKLVVEKLIDRAALVRAAAAVALTRRSFPGSRELVEARLRHGESNDDVRADLEKARSVLAGERTDVRWTEVGAEVIFSEMPLTYTQRLLRAVNLRLMASLDLAKIHNLQTDTEIVPTGPPGLPGDSNDNDHSDAGGEVQPGEAGDPIPAPPTDPSVPGEAPAGGASRTSQYQELRDLKVELIRNPYFGAGDLPKSPTTPGKGGGK